MSYERSTYTIRLVTPAFLGDARQASEFRGPPFKHLLREWWRLGEPLSVKLNERDLREREGALFGDARDDKSLRSRIVVSLGGWDKGAIVRWPTGGGQVKHPEVDPQKMPGQQVDSQLYLGYGPLGPRGLKAPPALGAGQVAEIRFRAPVNAQLPRTLALWHAFGAIGGRSRNGWGAIEVLDKTGKPIVDLSDLPRLAEVRGIQRAWNECLDRCWSHALGTDSNGGPLLWRTKQVGSWQQTMDALAAVKIAYRTSLFVNDDVFAERHLLALPITNHKLRNEIARLANQLCFKVIREGSACRGIVFHLPHAFPQKYTPRNAKDLAGGPSPAKWIDWQKGVWAKVHDQLDHSSLVDRWV